MRFQYLFLTRKMSHGLGKNYTIIVRMYNIRELFSTQNGTYKNQPYLFRQNVPTNPSMLTKSAIYLIIAPNMVIFR